MRRPLAGGVGAYFEKNTKCHTLLLYDLNLLSHEFIFNLRVFDRILTKNIGKISIVLKDKIKKNPNF